MYKFVIQGTVQGVGFRPYIYNSAMNSKLIGSVKNNGNGVEIIVDNKEIMLEILKNIPSLAKITNISICKIKNPIKYQSFNIIASTSENKSAIIPPDICICNDCIKEINSKNNKRFEYFFTSCTNCGPRYSILESFPYDKNNTSMVDFPLCEDCKKEYTNPFNRRFHAQTICCKKCGPDINLYCNNEFFYNDIKAITKTVELLKQNNIISIKGIGGFHLAAIPSKDTIKKLRQIKSRQNKPFALMYPDIKDVIKDFYVSNKEKELLLSSASPIVILNKKNQNDFKFVSDLNSVGVMLPYSALHHLIFKYLKQPLILTSSNQKGVTISSDITEQNQKYVLFDKRKIVNPIDDSVVKVINNDVIIIRKARGYVPKSNPIIKNNTKKQILALGANKNNTFSIYKNNSIITSEHFGNLNNSKTLDHFKKQIIKWFKLFNFQPDLILIDKHPEYNTNAFGKELALTLNVPYKEIQHHHAHIFSVADEHNVQDFIGIVCDGTGYGNDNTSWGGEIFIFKNKKIKRVAFMEQHQLIGNDLAIKNPDRIAFNILKSFLDKNDLFTFFENKYSLNELNLLYSQSEEGFNTSLTSSCGRILDACSALLNICQKRTYLGEPALKLESMAQASDYNPTLITPEIIKNNQTYTILTTPLVKFIYDNLNNYSKEQLAQSVFKYISTSIIKTTDLIKEENKLEKTPILFSGGVAYNSFINQELKKHNILFNKKIPCGDAGISYGQIIAYLNSVD